jgi:processive 1,2-diacylglycerol beta-glucosyltransferase
VAPRVLFLSAAVGVGHTSAARAVQAALRESDPAVETQTVDSYKYAASIFSKVVADGYIGMVKTVPQLYSYIYDRAERATHVPAFRRAVSRYTATNLRRLVERTQPDLVVCTHAFPCGVMSEYKRQYGPDLPVVGVVTDFVVHPFWIYTNVDAYAVATPQMRAALVARGVPPERVLLSGIPVDPRFGRPRLPRARLRAELDLPADRRIVLIMGGGVGIGPLDKMMRALGRIDEPLAAAVIVGRNRALERRIVAAAEQTAYPLRVFGFVDNVFDYMHASDVLLTKPGGLTSSEALSAQIPMVLVKPLPGQEERNTRYLVSRRAAVRASGERNLAATVEALLAPGSAREGQLERAGALRHPDAARRVAERILALLGRRDGAPVHTGRRSVEYKE